LGKYTWTNVFKNIRIQAMLEGPCPSWDRDFWITVKHLLLLVGVHVVQVLAVLLGDHLETSGLHVVHSDNAS